MLREVFQRFFAYGSRGGALSRLRRARSDLADETLDCADRHLSGILPASVVSGVWRIWGKYEAIRR